MRRTQIHIDEASYRRLRLRARAEGRTATAMIREAVERYLAEAAASDDPIGAFMGGGASGSRVAARDHDRFLYQTGR